MSNTMALAFEIRKKLFQKPLNGIVLVYLVMVVPGSRRSLVPWLHTFPVIYTRSVPSIKPSWDPA